MLIGLLGVLLVLADSYADSADDYLRNIEAEFEASAAMPIATEKPVAPTAAPGSLANRERLPLGLNEQTLEEVLRAEFGGTYAFYRRLNPQDKQRIFEFYLRDNRVSILRENILRLLGGGS